jgi:hypothetical protein
MTEAPDQLEEAARIVEAYAEAESEDRILTLLADIARSIRDRALND